MHMYVLVMITFADRLWDREPGHFEQWAWASLAWFDLGIAWGGQGP